MSNRLSASWAPTQMEGGAEPGGREGEQATHVKLTYYERAPNGKIVALPPHDEAEEQLYLEAYGRPYDGPR